MSVQRISIFTFFFITLFYFSYAQNQNPEIGFYGGLNLNMQTPSFNPQNPNVKFDQNNNKLGGNIGFIFNYPLHKNFILSTRLGYNGLNGDFDKTVNGIRYTFISKLYDIEFTPSILIYNLIPVDNLYLLFGLETGIPLSSKYSIDFDTISNKDNIPKTLFRLAAVLGTGYNIKLNKNLTLTPEITYRINFTQVSSEFKTWDIPQLRFGVNLTYSIGEEQISKQNKNESPPYLRTSFKEIRYFDDAGTPHKLERIKVEDVQYNELFPILPYIFCQSNTFKPNDSTQKLSPDVSSGEFSISSLDPDAMKLNLSTLDIIGSRLKKNPGSEITITGTNDTKTEAENKDLALQRAIFAKEYIVKHFAINSDRINIRNVGIPEKPSTQTLPEGIEENRRIEFKSSNNKILEPLMIEKDNQSFADPHIIEFIPYVESSDSVTLWTLEISQSGKILRVFKGTGFPEPVVFNFLPNELVKSPIPMEYSFYAENKRAANNVSNGSVPVDYFTSSKRKTDEDADKTISKFSLVLFDFDKSEISKQDMEIIEKHIIPSIKYNSTVKIYGFTDKIGDENYNKKLAEKRANTVKDYLENKIKFAKYEVYPIGESITIFDNQSPIGRHLSRTVQVIVSTKK